MHNRSRVDHDHSYDGSKTIDGEYVINVQNRKPVQILSVREIDSGDKESLIPSNNSGLAGNAYMSGETSDTTFDSVVDSIIRQEKLGSPEQSIVAQKSPENTDSFHSVEVVIMDGIANFSNVELRENVVDKSQAQNKQSDE